MTHTVTNFLENNRYVRCLFIDFSKAFDVIDHSILLCKLRDLDIPKQVYNWIISFLCDRDQVVKLNNVISKPCAINRGVVQGSGMGPTLFSVMVSDIKLLSVVNKLDKYVDDTTVLAPENTDVSIEEEFQSILDWAAKNNMLINKDKTKEIVFHRPDPRNFVPPTPIDGIEVVDSAKLLGIVVNSTLNFEEQVVTCLKQCSQRTFLIRKLRDQGLNSRCLTIVFDALILSRIRYALSAYGGFLNKGQIERVDGFLRRAFKYKLCCKVFTIDELLYHSDKNMFKAIQNETHCLNNLLPAIKNVSYGLRKQGHNYILPDIKFELNKKSFINRVLFRFI